MVPTQASPTLFSHLSCRQAQSVVLVVTGGPASARLHKHRCIWDAGNVVLIQVVINWPFFKVILLIQLMRRGISDPTFNFNGSPGLVDGKVLELAAGAFGDFLLHFLRKLLLEVCALVQGNKPSSEKEVLP